MASCTVVALLSANPASPLPFPVTAKMLMRRFLPNTLVMHVTTFSSRILVSKPSKVSVRVVVVLG
ncbi:hypothetical protein E2C01_093869 [Portunus trituberculatus]|uniref:Uncharacterized protein n=1 Tax=Portunus trituberculatus TaxID=210409 RepID=A0A5B7JZA6_PORTR|nr:hypothetical protein [Portunus trituberculatus]